MILEPNIAVVTGHSSGIGKAIADRLVTEGVFSVHGQWRVIGVSKKEANLSRKTGWGKASRYIRTRIGRRKIDLLVNNAGALDFNEDRKELPIMLLHAYTPFMLSKYLPIKNGGNIINIASTSGWTSSPEEPMYGAAKAALLHMTLSFANMLAPKKIRVNSISPGFTKTNLVPGKLPEHLLDKVPLKREIQPKEIADSVLHILNSPNMTGADILIDGGLIA